ncbi:MAG TPA: hypothetical protein VF783_16065 [Terriglobales bacterium]
MRLETRRSLSLRLADQRYWRADRTTFFVVVSPGAVAIVGYLLWWRWRSRLNHNKT